MDLAKYAVTAVLIAGRSMRDVAVLTGRSKSWVHRRVQLYRDEQWCADFAAGAWRLAGAPLVYQFINGDQNSSSASFYEWRVRHHTWRLVGSGYVPQLGDRTVYVLNAAGLVAQHVAVVVSYTPGERGPNAVNGDGDHTGFSRVENQTNEYNAAASGAGTSLPAGCVSPSA